MRALAAQALDEISARGTRTRPVLGAAYLWFGGFLSIYAMLFLKTELFPVERGNLAFIAITYVYAALWLVFLVGKPLLRPAYAHLGRALFWGASFVFYLMPAGMCGLRWLWPILSPATLLDPESQPYFNEAYLVFNMLYLGALSLICVWLMYRELLPCRRLWQEQILAEVVVANTLRYRP
jgi:hypothetical protein